MDGANIGAKTPAITPAKAITTISPVISLQFIVVHCITITTSSPAVGAFGVKITKIHYSDSPVQIFPNIPH